MIVAVYSADPGHGEKGMKSLKILAKDSVAPGPTPD